MRVRTVLPALVIVGALQSCASSRNDSVSSDEQAIRAMYERFSAAVASKDIEMIMSFYVPDSSLVAFDAFPPREYRGAAAYRKDYQNFFADFPGPATSTISDLRIMTEGTLAVAHAIDRWRVTGKDGQPLEIVFRATNAFRKINGKWLSVHEHLSVPVDPITGKADFNSKP